MSQTIDYGIDLGTTNSSIAVCRHGDVKVFQSTDLMNVTPSVVYVSKSGRMLVGKRAYDTWVADPENTQAEFKRWMGFSDTLSFPASGKQLSAVQLSAEVLKALRADAERQTQESINASVITVPAAFGNLQCEATTQAARMAGLEQCPLLQEPIAAAIAFGASPSSRDQRWMVFDLGGGTLDIAIVSTRNGRLAVLEHQGNNRLGGKDIDRLIAMEMIWNPLAQAFNLPDFKNETPAYNRLMRAITRNAEQAKIALSTAGQTTVDLFDIGEDKDGKTIEMTLVLKRSEMESLVRPVVDQCLDLARRALEGARVSAADLDRVLLIGGPTQMPVIRDALAATGVKLDHSLDPMTAVSHGAALFASTQERTVQSQTAAVAAAPLKRGVAKLQLAYERASGTSKSPVAVLVENGSAVAEIKIDAAGGFWTSGWIPVAGGCAQSDVVLAGNKPATRFTITARDVRGGNVSVSPDEFTITYMLPMAAPPLPHTIAIELSTTNGLTKFDPVFTRHVPLPAEARKTYIADRTLRPSETDTTLPVKFWEIEVSDDPQEKWWAGCVHLRSDQIKRPITEGAALELTIRIDASRKMTVDLFVPSLNQTFNENVYIPDPPASRSQLHNQLDLCFERLHHIARELFASDHPDLMPRCRQLQLRAEVIAEQVAEAEQRGVLDPDASAGPTAEVRKLRLQIAQLEEQGGIGSAAPSLTRKLRTDMLYVGRMVEQHGNESEKQEFARLNDQYQRYRETDEVRGLKWVETAVWQLHFNIIRDQSWYWSNCLDNLKRPGRSFVNQQRAQRLLADGEAARDRGDVPALRTAVSAAWDLLPPEQAAAARDQETASGLRMG